MSTLLELESITVSNFSGPKPELNLDDLAPGDALAAQNVEYGKGSFQTRRPFAHLLTSPSGRVQSMVQWIQSGFNRVLYYCDTGLGATLRCLDLKTLVDTSLGMVDPATETFQASESGTRQYISYVKSETGSGLNLPVGADESVAVGVTPGSSAVTADKRWRAPLALTTDITISQTNFSTVVGDVTPGQHTVCMVAQSRSGFQLVPGVTFAYTALGGSDILKCTFGASMPAEVIRLQFAITPVGSTRYFLIPEPSNEFNSAIGFAPSSNIQLNFYQDDVTLMRGTEITSLFNNYYKGLGGLTLKPFNTLPFGNRMGYMCQLPDTTQSGTDQTVMYFSSPNYYQDINLALSRVQLPGALRACAWFAQRGVVRGVRNVDRLI